MNARRLRRRCAWHCSRASALLELACARCRRSCKRITRRPNTTPRLSSRRRAKSRRFFGRTRTCASRSAPSASTAWRSCGCLEGQNPGDLDRARIPRDVIEVGDAVTFAGNPSTRRERRMYVTNVLLAGRNGDRAARERAAALVAGPLSEPPASHRRSGARGRGPRRRHLSRLAADRRQDAGLGRRSAAHGRRARRVASLRRAARRPRHRLHAARHAAGHHAQRPVRDSLRARRRRHRARERVPRHRSSHSHDCATAVPRGAARRRRSAGRRGEWDGETLVVTTTDIDWPYFQLYGLEGVPQSTRDDDRRALHAERRRHASSPTTSRRPIRARSRAP